jgi:hypothetical protein
MATAEYTATWVSQEVAGATSSGPNSLRFFADDASSDADAIAFATAMDGFIAGDYMSLTKQISYETEAEAEATVVPEDAIVAHLAGTPPSPVASEHVRFMSVLPGDSVVGHLAEVYGDGGAHNGDLKLLKSEDSADLFRYVSH